VAVKHVPSLASYWGYQIQSYRSDIKSRFYVSLRTSSGPAFGGKSHKQAMARVIHGSATWGMLRGFDSRRLHSLV
jgi:hypothetical protein